MRFDQYSIVNDVKCRDFRISRCRAFGPFGYLNSISRPVNPAGTARQLEG
jgi:hypothetical protein